MVLEVVGPRVSIALDFIAEIDFLSELIPRRRGRRLIRRRRAYRRCLWRRMVAEAAVLAPPDVPFFPERSVKARRLHLPRKPGPQQHVLPPLLSNPCARSAVKTQTQQKRKLNFNQDRQNY